MEDVESFFKALSLGQYVPACESNGYDRLNIILKHEEEDFDIFEPLIDMLPGYLHRLKKAVKERQVVSGVRIVMKTRFRERYLSLNPGGIFRFYPGLNVTT